MSFDELQLVWQHERSATVPADVDTALLRQVQADSRKFSRRIFWRDVREVGASILVAFVFGKVAWEAQREGGGSWPAWVAAALPLGVAAFLLVDRWRSRQREAPQGDALLIEIDRAQRAVGDQIKLLRNVFWWYLLPLLLSGLLLVLQVVLFAPMSLPPLLGGLVKTMVGIAALLPLGAINWWIWKLNQNAVKNNLQPQWDELAERRRELLGER